MDPMNEASPDEVPASHMNGVLNTGVKSTDQLLEVGDINVDHRVKRKAKRLLKQHSREVSSDISVLQTTRNWKNSRKSRNAVNRKGMPKKGSGGGKNVWTKIVMEPDDIQETDRNDPNYDSDCLDDDTELKSVIPELSEDDLKKNIEIIILEYYEHGDVNEALISIDELSCMSKKYMIPLQAIEMALDHKPSHREMTSVLLSDLCVDIIKQKDMITAFNTLLSSLPDLVLDIPDAPDAIGNFIARAIADQCLNPKVIKIFKESNSNDHAQKALLKTESILTSEQAVYRLDSVWGVGGGLRPVKTLVRQMNLLLEEYVSSGDIEEAMRCLVELEVPHFHHELVYEAVIMTFESLNPEVEEAMCKLLKALSDAIIITPDMMKRGFFRVYEDMPDIIIDVPLAYTILDRFVNQCHKVGIISDEITKKLPARGRKRFVSEGDGGRVKEHY